MAKWPELIVALLALVGLACADAALTVKDFPAVAKSDAAAAMAGSEALSTAHLGS